MIESEIKTKQKRLAEFLDRRQLDGVLLTLRNNFAWITCGHANYVSNNTPVGVASILATRDSRVCLANEIEAPRMKDEELPRNGIDVLSFPWWDADAARNTVREVIGDRRIAADTPQFGLDLPPLPKEFAQLRWSLTSDEIERYREGARRATDAMETACRDTNFNDTEHTIAGRLAFCLHQRGCNPLVTLVAADQRIERFRHPIPTGLKAQHTVMLVTCAEFGGLISCLTRFINFGPPSQVLEDKLRAICNIDAAVNLSTRPGRTLGEIFTILQKAYADNGHPDQWRFHHQGGSTGYAGRESLARPGSGVTVRDNQAFAWNPSIPGIKSEDTILCTNNGIEVLTAPSQNWPRVEGKFENRSLPRAGILVR